MTVADMADMMASMTGMDLIVRIKDGPFACLALIPPILILVYLMGNLALHGALPPDVEIEDKRLRRERLEAEAEAMYRERVGREGRQ